MKNLCENPKEKYQSLNGSKRCVLSVESGYFRFSRYNKDGVAISTDLAAGGFNDNVRQDHEWELVREPVDFMTAVKSGKKITSNCGKIKRCTPSWLLKEGLLTIDLIQGKWYIED